MHELMEHGESKSKMFRSIASVVDKAMRTDLDISLSEPIEASADHHIGNGSRVASMTSTSAVSASATDKRVVFLGIESVHSELVSQLDILIK